MRNCECKQNDETIVFLSDVLRVLAEGNRLKILCYLQKNGEKCVCDIQSFLKLPQNLTSHHLKILKDSHLIRSRKQGLKVYYKISETTLDNNLTKLNMILGKGDR